METTLATGASKGIGLASAAAAASLISDEASFATGQPLHVCGGLSLGAAPV